MIGVLLLNMGGPDTLKAVRPFLYNLFSDRRIIRLGPPFLQKPLARLISVIRYKKTEKMYRVIGGRSPLLTITKAQAEALEKELIIGGRQGRIRVYIGMRYWHPFIEDTVERMRREGVKAVLAISLFPHYSRATSGSAISKFEETVRECPLDYRIVPSWHDHHLYIESLCDVIAKGIDSFGGEGAEVLFSAHSLPVSIIESGDPYALHIEGTILEVAKRVGIRWHLSYQSRSGPVKWLRPSTEEKIRELAAAGVKNLLVVPVSFVSDHIETLFEIDVSYSNLAGALGVRLRRAESLNTHPVFIRALRELVLTGISESGWRQC
jgi:protoporphyrin/coproporphyrin ferrochelatase